MFPWGIPGSSAGKEYACNIEDFFFFNYCLHFLAPSFVDLFSCFSSLFHYFWSDLAISFFLLTLGFTLFLDTWGIKLSHLRIFFLIYAFITINFPLRTALLPPQSFGMLHFHFHLCQDIFFISLFISCLMHWFKNVFLISTYLWIFFFLLLLIFNFTSL